MKSEKDKLELQALLLGCRNNDRRAQQQVYERYYAAMLSVCMRYAYNNEEARDIMQDGFVKVFKHIGNFKPKHSLYSWIKRIMINTAIDYYRKNKKHHQQTDIDDVAYHLANNNASAISIITEQEILALVQRLSPAYRTVFSLYVIDGYTHREVGKLLNISEGTSKSNLAKARAKLKKIMQSEYNL